MDETESPPKRDIEDRTYQFALRIVRLCRSLDKQPGVSRTLGRQLIRAGTSVGAHVEEAHAAQSRPDFISKMSIALKEARETRFWLRLIVDSDLLAEHLLTPLLTEANEIMLILGAIASRCRRNDAE